MRAARLELRDVGKSFGRHEVLAGVSLSAGPGEFISIVGPSGAGKSTILKLLIGELLPDTGELLFDCKPLVDNRNRFAFMPQRDALMPWRRVIDNATIGLDVRGVRRKVARERVQPLIAEFGLAGFERHFPAQLSGGMRQRTALLRTVVQERDILLLDEPFGALDALTRTTMQKWLEATWIKHSWTTILITHDVREAVFLSDRIYVLSARPARVVRDFQIALPRPRQLAGAMALEAEILNLLLNPHADQRT